MIFIIFWFGVRPRIIGKFKAQQDRIIHQSEKIFLSNFNRELHNFRQDTELARKLFKAGINQENFEFKLNYFFKNNSYVNQIWLYQRNEKKEYFYPSKETAFSDLKSLTWQKLTDKQRLAYTRDSLGNIYSFCRIEEEDFDLITLYEMGDFRSYLDELIKEDIKYEYALWFKEQLIVKSSPAYHELDSIRLKSYYNQFHKLSLAEKEHHLLTEMRLYPVKLDLQFNDNEIYKFIYSIFKLVLFVWLALFILIIAIAYILSAFITKPIDYLRDKIRPFSDLNFAHEIKPVNEKEFKSLSIALEKVRKKMQVYQRENVDKIMMDHQKVRTVINHMGGMIAVVDGRDQFLFTNFKWKEFFSDDLSLSYSEYMKQYKIDISKEISSTNFYDNLKITRSSSHAVVEQKNGREFHFAFSKLSLAEQGSEQLSLVSLRSRSREVEIEKAQKQMMDVMIHELKNPLAIIIGYIELLKREEEEQQHNTQVHDTILRNSIHLNELIQRFSAIQKLESNFLDLVKFPFDLKALVQDVIEFNQIELRKENIDLKFEVIGELPKLNADKQLVRQVIHNLVSNAIKYGEPNRRIEISLRKENETLCFRIQDNGYGIPEADQGNIFKKFFRVQSNQKAFEKGGTGLGLAFVKEILDKHNGTISFKSIETKGSKFKVCFPID